MHETIERALQELAASRDRETHNAPTFAAEGEDGPDVSTLVEWPPAPRTPAELDAEAQVVDVELP